MALPEGVLDGVDPALFGGGALVTELLVSDFDPHSGSSAGSPAKVVSSVVSFSLFGGTSRAALPVANLTTPLYFDIPLGDTPEGGPPGEVASCVYYDEATGVYDTEGCIGVDDDSHCICGRGVATASERAMPTR